MSSARAEFLADTDYNSSNGKGLITVQPVDLLHDLLKQLPQLSQLWVASQLVSTLPVMLWIGDRFRRRLNPNVEFGLYVNPHAISGDESLLIGSAHLKTQSVHIDRNDFLQVIIQFFSFLFINLSWLRNSWPKIEP